MPTTSSFKKVPDKVMSAVETASEKSEETGNTCKLPRPVKPDVAAKYDKGA